MNADQITDYSAQPLRLANPLPECNVPPRRSHVVIAGQNLRLRFSNIPSLALNIPAAQSEVGDMFRGQYRLLPRFPYNRAALIWRTHFGRRLFAIQNRFHPTRIHYVRDIGGEEAPLRFNQPSMWEPLSVAGMNRCVSACRPPAPEGIQPNPSRVWVAPSYLLPRN